MDEGEDILDHLYKDTLGDAEMPVSGKVWERIEKTIEEKRRKRILYFSAAAGLLMITGLFVYLGSRVESKARVIANQVPVNSVPVNPVAVKSSEGFSVAAHAVADHSIVTHSSGAKSVSYNAKSVSYNAKSVSYNAKSVVASGVTANKVMTEPEVTAVAAPGIAAVAEAGNIPAEGGLLPATANMKKSDVDSIAKPQIAAKPDSIAKPETALKPESPGGGNIVSPVAESRIHLFARAELGGQLAEVRNSINGLSGSNPTGSRSGSLSYNGMLNLGYVFKNKLGLNVGLGISKYSSSFSYTGYDTVRQKGYVLTSISAEDPEHFTNYYRDTTYLIKKKFTSVSTFGCQFLTVPVTLEYVFNIGKHWALAPLLGMNFNFVISAQSTVPNSVTNETLVYNSSNFKRLTTSGVSGLRIEYSLNEKWKVYVSPGYLFFMGNLNKSSNELNVSPSAITASGGVKYCIR